ncbi:MAG TPA: ABC transporter permease, partial [Gaiellaceae bacterium]|nr:ABC transporter permease [Gaiellaceae bacterium]
VQGVLANRLRSFLTLLGITIGVASVIILVAVGRGSSASIEQQIEGLGTNMLTVQSGGRFFGRAAARSISFQFLTLKDVKALEDKNIAPDIKSVSPVIDVNDGTLTRGSATESSAQVLATTPGYAEARKETVAAGSFLTSGDEANHNRVAVLGPTTAENLFGSSNPLGQSFLINGATFRVEGVLESKGSNGIQDQDDLVVLPLTTAQDLLVGESGQIDQIVLEAKSSSAVNAAEAEATSILTPLHHNTDGSAAFSILNQASLLSATSSSNHTFTVLLAAVAAISLLVGGIGVMNIMLVTVTERTREIGIRKAIGARKGDVLGQFLTEAVLLSILGGLLGVAAGLVGSRFKIVGVQPVVQAYAVFLAFGVGVAVGLFFGIYPANRAASLRPIEALRYE